MELVLYNAHTQKRVDALADWDELVGAPDVHRDGVAVEAIAGVTRGATSRTRATFKGSSQLVVRLFCFVSPSTTLRKKGCSI